MDRIALRTSLALAAVSFAAIAQASRPAVRALGAGLSAETAAHVPKMREHLRAGLMRDKPNDGMRKALAPTTLFVGSYDRHSNMAACWALLMSARVAGDADEARDLRARFTVDALRAERALHRDFAQWSPVRPYDETWLVLLLAELERQFGAGPESDAARAFRAEAENRLLGYAELHPTADPESAPATRPDGPAESAPAVPRAPRPGSRPWRSGAYESAAWPLVVLSTTSPAHERTAARLAALRADRLPEARRLAELAARARPSGRTYDFLWPPAIYALVDRLAPPAAEISAYAPPPYAPPPAKVRISNCHVLGAELSKLWPIAFDAGAGDAAALK
ncbi:MAG TPA: DUF2891 family protein, partial [Planctomycetota bacterium]|nr:DUF2891 family protein [Planctomycetota bacterium]